MTDETNVTELLPCPFCGSEELMHGSDYPGWDGRETTGNVQCGNCDAFTLQDTEADAIAAWNTRLAHSLPSQADEIAALRARVAELEAENDRLTKAVGSGILGELLNDEETDEFVNFIKFLRGQTKEAGCGKV